MSDSFRRSEGPPTLVPVARRGRISEAVPGYRGRMSQIHDRPPLPPDPEPPSPTPPGGPGCPIRDPRCPSPRLRSRVPRRLVRANVRPHERPAVGRPPAPLHRHRRRGNERARAGGAPTRRAGQRVRPRGVSLLRASARRHRAGIGHDAGRLARRAPRWWCRRRSPTTTLSSQAARAAGARAPPRRPAGRGLGAEALHGGGRARTARPPPRRWPPTCCVATGRDRPT